MTTGTGRRSGGGPREASSRDSGFVEKVVHIRRVTKVIKGGKHFKFNAVVVVGDGNGKVGIGYGKGKEVPDAVRKATSAARKRMLTIVMRGRTVPQLSYGKFGASNVLIKPAAPGTGVIAGGPVRAVLEAAGVRDVLTKSLGSSNPINVVRATFNALSAMRDPAREIELRRGRAQEKPAVQQRPPMSTASSAPRPSV